MENSQCTNQVQLQSRLIDGSLVNCIMCGSQMPLSQLVAHQNQCPSRPKWNTVFDVRDHKRCTYCHNHPWIQRKLMDRHLERKHPEEFRAMKGLQPTKITTDTEKCAAIDVEENITLQRASFASQIPHPKVVDAKAVPAIAPAIVPAIVPETESPQQVSCAMSRSRFIDGYPILSVEQDEDGFAELVHTIK